MKTVNIAYIAWSLLVIALIYIIPYVLLKNAMDLSLYVFWLLASMIHMLITIAYVKFKFKELKP
ncbi:MAG: hypothetical protein DRO23_01660 [Thermoprotei archaeon]|nr:MAG: hypothetical protein DRO23_01660 [Thermoprotei archaeon]